MRIISVEYDSNSNPVNIVCEDDGGCYAFRIIEKGQWIATQSADVYRCSNCKKAVKMDMFCSSSVLREFCPKCGAEMSFSDYKE